MNRKLGKIELSYKLIFALGIENKFVWLRETKEGKRYIEYAFISGKPNACDCLSWYDSLQPISLKRNHHNIEEWKKTISKPNKLYYANYFRPRPGYCPKEFFKFWSYEEPGKFGCWYLEPLTVIQDIDYYIRKYYQDRLTPEFIKNFINNCK